MPIELDLAPQTTANTNPFGITFGSSAKCELRDTPEMIINKNLGIVDLDYVNESGLIFSKGANNGFVPWSNILVLKY